MDRKGLTLLAWIGVVCVGTVWAQELKLTIGNPIAAAGSPMVKKKSTAFVVRLEGCSDPRASIAGVAEGILPSGARRTDKLTLVVAQPGVFAVDRTWPEAAFGTWIVNLMATCQERKVAALVPIVEGGFSRETTKYFDRLATPAEVDAALKAHAARK